MSFNLLQYYFELIGVNTPTLGLKYCVESHIRSWGGGSLSKFLLVCSLGAV
jgi:hypothetical protein